MDWAQGLQRAVDYMEEHLEEETDFVAIARQAYSSSFHFQRVFHIICGCTIGEYIRNRRLSLADTDLSAGGGRVLDVALKYGYNSPESFSRAFTKFHGVTPAQAKSGKARLRSFSPLRVKLILEGGTTMDYRIVKEKPFQIAARRFRCEGGGEITQQHIRGVWEACSRDGTLDKLCRYARPDDIFGGAVVGICFDNPDQGDFDYAIGAHCPGGEVAQGLSLEEVPAGTWAVFPYAGKMPQAFQELYKKIYTEFFPSSSYQPAGGMCIEVYPSAQVEREDFPFEFWLSVEAKP